MESPHARPLSTRGMRISHLAFLFSPGFPFQGPALHDGGRLSLSLSLSLSFPQFSPPRSGRVASMPSPAFLQLSRNFRSALLRHHSARCRSHEPAAGRDVTQRTAKIIAAATWRRLAARNNSSRRVSTRTSTSPLLIVLWPVAVAVLPPPYANSSSPPLAWSRWVPRRSIACWTSSLARCLACRGPVDALRLIARFGHPRKAGALDRGID